MTFNFKLLNIDDQSLNQDLFELDQLYFEPPWSLGYWGSIFQNRDQYYLFCIQNPENKCIGFAIFKRYEDFLNAELEKILIAPQYRNRGLSASLMNMALDILTEKGLNDIFLDVSIRNSVALHLYEKFHFEKISIKKAYYQDGSDAYAMSLSLKRRK